jgi:hypothetical protein
VNWDSGRWHFSQSQKPTHYFSPLKDVSWSQVLVAHICNPSYSGGRDQEDRGWKPAQVNSFQAPILKKNPSQKRAGGVTQGSNPSTATKKNVSWAGCRWLTPVIPATWQAEIRRIAVPGQCRQIVRETLSPN